MGLELFYKNYARTWLVHPLNMAKSAFPRVLGVEPPSTQSTKQESKMQERGKDNKMGGISLCYLISIN